MARSTRFPVAVHILTVLAAKEGEFVSSDFIARSVATNRVVVRRIISLLHAAKWVTSQAGIHGGAKLEVEPEQVNLLDVYRAVEKGSIFRVHESEPKCPIACCVKQDLESFLEVAEAAMEEKLAGKTLADMSKRAIHAYGQRMTN